MKYLKKYKKYFLSLICHFFKSQKNFKRLLTNGYKNANINTVVRHWHKIWRGGRVGLWHQS